MQGKLGKMKLGVVVLILILYETGGSFVSNNVIFRKISEVSLTKAEWKVSFDLDLASYTDVLEMVSKDLSDVRRGMEQVYVGVTTEQSALILNFGKLRQEVGIVDKRLSDIQKRFWGIWWLKTSNKRRRKRAIGLIPFVGKTLSFLFGTSTQSEIEKIRQNIKILKDKDEKIVHVVKEGLTLINANRVGLSENRKTINDLVGAVKGLNDHVENITTVLGKELTGFEEHVQAYLQIDINLNRIKQILTEIEVGVEHFHLQLNMLVTGRLSPSLITPENLLKILRDVQNKVEAPFQLPKRPEENLWGYYQLLKCTTVVVGFHMVITVQIPLIATTEVFEIFAVHSLPVPYSINQTGNRQRLTSGLTANYDIDFHMLGVNKQRTKYVLLLGEESLACMNQLDTFCSVLKPVYPVSLSKKCEIALFMKVGYKIDKYCKIEVSVDTSLPRAEYISNGKWVITTNEDLILVINCKNKQESTEIRVRAPVGIISLQETCSASNEFLTLPPFYERESKFNVEISESEFFKNYNKTRSHFWNPIKHKFPTFDPVKVTNKLETLKKFSVENLEQELDKMYYQTDDSKWEFPEWIWTLFLFIIIILVLSVYCIIVRRRHNKSNRTPLVSGIEGVNKPHPEMVSMEDIPGGVETRVGDGQHVPGVVGRTAPGKSQVFGEGIVKSLCSALDETSKHEGGTP